MGFELRILPMLSSSRSGRAGEKRAILGPSSVSAMAVGSCLSRALYAYAAALHRYSCYSPFSLQPTCQLFCLLTSIFFSMLCLFATSRIARHPEDPTAALCTCQGKLLATAGASEGRRVPRHLEPSADHGHLPQPFCDVAASASSERGARGCESIRLFIFLLPAINQR